jgi:hypothetical protein
MESNVTVESGVTDTVTSYLFDHLFIRVNVHAQIKEINI